MYNSIYLYRRFYKLCQRHELACQQTVNSFFIFYRYNVQPLILRPLNAYRMCIKVGGKLWERIVIIETSEKGLDKYGLKTISF